LIRGAVFQGLDLLLDRFKWVAPDLLGGGRVDGLGRLLLLGD
jgi:hypothetical protein